MSPASRWPNAEWRQEGHERPQYGAGGAICELTSVVRKPHRATVLIIAGYDYLRVIRAQMGNRAVPDIASAGDVPDRVTIDESIKLLI